MKRFFATEVLEPLEYYQGILSEWKHRYIFMYVYNYIYVNTYIIISPRPSG